VQAAEVVGLIFVQAEVEVVFDCVVAVMAVLVIAVPAAVELVAPLARAEVAFDPIDCAVIVDVAAVVFVVELGLADVAPADRPLIATIHSPEHPAVAVVRCRSDFDNQPPEEHICAAEAVEREASLYPVELDVAWSVADSAES